MYCLKYETALHILRMPKEVYAFWRQPQNLLPISQYLESITSTSGELDRSQWTIRSPRGSRFDIVAELVCNQEDELLAWRGIVDTDVEVAAVVEFEAGPDGHGTILTLSLSLSLPDAKAHSDDIKRLSTHLERHIEADLQRLKQFLEASDTSVEAEHPPGVCG